MVERKPEIWLAGYSPILGLANRYLARRFDSVPEFSDDEVRRLSTIGRGSALEPSFVEHIGTITAINTSRGIKTVFIGQIVNRDLLARHPHLEFLAGSTRGEDVLSVHERFNSILRGAATSIGAGYIDAGIGNFSNNEFSDVVHFSAVGSRKFAGLIASRIENYCEGTDSAVRSNETVSPRTE